MRRWSRALLALGMGGCGAAARGPAAAPAAAPAKLACPAPAELEAIARAHVPVAPDATLAPRCIAGAFPQAGWAVDVEVQTEQGRAYQTFAIAAADRRVLAAGDVETWGADEVGGRSLDAAVDLDGDGVDELTYSREQGVNGSDYRWFVVAHVADGALGALDGIATYVEQPQTEHLPAFHCEALVKVGAPDASGARALTIAPGAVSGTPPARDCELHPRALALVHGKLVPKP